MLHINYGCFLCLFVVVYFFAVAIYIHVCRLRKKYKRDTINIIA